MEHGTRDQQRAQRPERVSLGELIHQHVRVAVEQAVQEELVALLDAGRYERRATRRGYRNGYKHHTLTGPLGLTLPRVLWRAPYADDGRRADGFRFREEAAGPDGRGLLWGSAVYAFGAVLARAFADSG